MWRVYSEQERRISFASAREGRQSPDIIDILKHDYVPQTISPSDVTMVASGDIVHIIWTESAGPLSNLQQQVVVRTSTDAGKSFGDPVQMMSITTVPEFAYHVFLVASVVIGAIIAMNRVVVSRKEWL